VSSPGLAFALAEWVAGLRYEQVPEKVLASVKQRILDTVGVALAGASSDAGQIARRKVIEWSADGRASLLGETTRVTAAAAALVNGTYAHALDFDDTHLPSILHPSAPLVPAALAAAQAQGASGRQLLVALTAAYEVACRLGMAQYDPVRRHSILIDRGLHATSYIGAISSAVAAAKLAEPGVETIANAIGVATGMGAGLIETSRAGGSAKKFQGGWASQCGIVAAEMAQAGLTGAMTAIEGRYGLFTAICGDSWRPAAVTEALGKDWLTPGIVVKPYPCQHYTHSIVDAAIRFRALGVRPTDVKAVEIGLARGAIPAIGEPIETKRRPANGYLAQFSGPYIFAAALAGGGGLGVSTCDFTAEALADPLRRQVAETCTVVPDAECDAIFPEQFPARVTLTLIDAGVVEERVLANRGGPGNPLTRDELRRKLEETAGDRADAIDQTVYELDEAPSVDRLLEATCSLERAS
jgi:2-methylcitrate dehydratase PrpD